MELIHTVFLNVVPFLVLLTVLVFVHELGHYLVARYNGVKVEVFSIGFGPKLFGWKSKSGTHWKVSLIPFGGYIKMTNENEVFATEKEEKRDKDSAVAPDSFLAKSVWQRMAISVAGPGANYLFAILLLTFIFSVYGQRVPIPGATIGEVHKESVAERAGIQSGDKVLEADGHAIGNVEELQKAISSHVDQELTLKLYRQATDQNVVVTVRPAAVEVRGKQIGRLGVELKPLFNTVSNNPFVAFKNACVETFDVSWSTLKALGQMIVGERGADGLTGPIGIASLTGKIAKHGLHDLFVLAALLSINLGLINLFPIPVLDGGHILFYFIEGIRGKPVTEKAQEFAFKVGFLIIMSLIVFSFWNDLSRLKFFQWVMGLFN
jgi:regulator of sigma E protease